MIRAISRAERIFLRVSSGWPQPHKWFLAAAVLSLSLPAVAQVGNSFLRASPPQSPFAGQPGSDAKYVAGEVLVRFRRGAARAAMNSLHAKVGATVIRASRVVEVSSAFDSSTKRKSAKPSGYTGKIPTYS